MENVTVASKINQHSLVLLNDTHWVLTRQCPCFLQGWTVKSKTSFNKVAPVTILGHSYLLNSEGNLLTLHCLKFIHLKVIVRFHSMQKPASPTSSRWGRAVSPGLRLSGLADLQEGFSSAGGFHVDHRLRLGVHAALWADVTGTRTRGSSNASRLVRRTNYTCKMTADTWLSSQITWCLKTRTCLTCWSWN